MLQTFMIYAGSRAVTYLHDGHLYLVFASFTNLNTIALKDIYYDEV